MKNNKLLVILLAVITVTAVMLAGCGGGSKTDYSSLQKDVVKGSSVFVDGGDVVFFGYNNMLGSAIFHEGEAEDFLIEGGFTGDVYAIAIYNGMLYVSASDGFFSYDLNIFSGKSDASPVVLWENKLSRFNSFQIYDGKIFFLYGVDLCYIPLEGGEETRLATEVGDFEVTSEGILYSKKDGGLHLLSTDFKEDKEVGQVAPAAYLSLGKDGVYFRQDGMLRCCSPDSGETVDVATAAVPGERAYPWVSGSSIMYSDDEGNYYLITDKGEEMAGSMPDFPEKYMGTMYKDWIVSQTADYGKLDVISLRDGSHTSYDLATELAEDLSKSAGGQSGQGGTSQGGDNGGSSGKSGSYDLTEGMQTVTSSDGSIEYIYFNDFMITMPNNEKWSMETSPRAVTFYLFSAQQEGYGGKLVSIAAYDIDDDTYKHLPSYHEAGITANTNVRLIAEYPTDVQWNHDDAEQEADYKDLQTYLQKIGDGAVNSPLQTADSD